MREVAVGVGDRDDLHVLHLAVRVGDINHRLEIVVVVFARAYVAGVDAVLG